MAPRREKIPAPGGKKDTTTNFYNKRKWRLVLSRSELDLAGKNIVPRGCLIISNAITKNRYVTKLDLSHNSIGNQGVVDLAQVLKINTVITSINLSHNDLSDVAGIALASAFIPCSNPTGQPGQWNRNVMYLTLSGNRFGDDTMLAFSNAAGCHRDLTRVDLTWNSVGANGTKCLLRSMQRNPNCTFLLAANSIGDEGVGFLVDAWLRFASKSVTTMNLYRNDISRNGAESIGKVFAKNDYLMDMNLSSNTLGHRGAAHLQKALVEGHHVLKFLNLQENLLGDEGAVEIAKVISMNNTINKINLSSNGIGDKGGVAIMKAVLQNAGALEFLDLSENNFREKTVDEVHAVIRGTKTLRLMDLRLSVADPSLRQSVTIVGNENPELRLDVSGPVEDFVMDALDKIGEHMDLILMAEEKAKSKKRKGKKKTS